MKKKSIPRVFLFACCLLVASLAASQMPFEASGQVFLVLNGSNALVEVINDASSPAIVLSPIGGGLPEPMDALAFRKTDRLLYAISINGNELFRIDAAGNATNLGALPLNPNLFYIAGDISADGSTFLVVGADASGFAVEFSEINLNDPNFATQTVFFSNPIILVDVAYHPTSGQVFGFDQMNRTVVNFSPANFQITGMTQWDFLNNSSGVFFDAFGDLFSYGTTASGAVDAIHNIDELTGEETTVASGSIHQVADVASAWGSVEINFEPNPAATFPCAEIEFVYTIANASGQAVNGVDLVHPLPSGFTFTGVENNPFGGSVVTGNPAEVRIENLNVWGGVNDLVVKVEVGDLPDGAYPSQATLFNLPGTLGNVSQSDSPATNDWEDATNVNVNVFEDDSLFYEHFFCLQNGPLILVANQFGNNIEWFNGSTSPNLTVTESGLYTLEAASGCETLTVSYAVTAATCPYTIEISSEPIPQENYPCSEITWRYIIQNDSGEEREGFSFNDTLPEGFLYLGVLENAFGGEVVTDLPSRHIRMEDMNMPLGFHTLDLLVEVGDIPPGSHRTRALLTELPAALGTIRLSDDPNTLFLDSTEITVLGTLDDSIRIDTHICPGTEVLLNSAGLGQAFLWEDGGTDTLFLVTGPGIVKLTVFDGCEPSFVEYHVAAAPDIQVEIIPAEIEIFLGEKQDLLAQIANADDSLFFAWMDPLDTTLSCLNCLGPVAFPLETVVYKILVNNQFCRDSAFATILVDNTRRIYAPNVFSPNGDGINDHFFLQSPDPGELLFFAVFDRWGNAVFESGQSVFNDESSGWDGWHRGEKANVDSYVWRAKIRFIDSKTEDFFGPVMVLR